MKTRTISLVSLAIMAVSAVGLAQGTALAKEKEGRAVINFANLPNSVRNWRGEGTEGIYFEAANGDWYHATFMSPCQGLPYSVSIGIVTDGLNQLDKFSSILVDSPPGSERCWFKTFEKIDGEPPKKSS